MAPKRIPPEISQALHTLHAQGRSIRALSRQLGVSRNTVRSLVRQPPPTPGDEAEFPPPIDPERLALITALFERVEGNVVRLRELLAQEHHLLVSYSTLTRWVREGELRGVPRRAGSYHFGPGEEAQHDTSPHRPELGGKRVTAQCAALALAFSRRLFLRYYPRFTRFEAKAFLSAAFAYFEGTCPRCIIDNISVLVSAGAGPEATIAPEMLAFAAAYGVTFRPHRVGDPNRKARVERPFRYIEGNFLAGRTFEDFDDLNAQALAWCNETANAKVKRSLGMSPDAAFLLEKPHLQPLPEHPPPVFETHERIVDVIGYVSLDTVRYSVPERFVAKRVTVYKEPDTVKIYYRRRCIASHPRLIGQRDAKHTLAGHHTTPARHQNRRAPPPEEHLLIGDDERLERYVGELKHRAPGRGVRVLRRLLELKRTYPRTAFLSAIDTALTYGLYDLARLESLILKRVAGDFFALDDPEPPDDPDD